MLNPHLVAHLLVNYNGHLLLICSSLSTDQYMISQNLTFSNTPDHQSLIRKLIRRIAWRASFVARFVKHRPKWSRSYSKHTARVRQRTWSPNILADIKAPKERHLRRIFCFFLEVWKKQLKPTKSTKWWYPLNSIYSFKVLNYWPKKPSRTQDTKHNVAKTCHGCFWLVIFFYWIFEWSTLRMPSLDWGPLGTLL